ncbi:MAG: hypothetical protein U0228_02590 [Myxococcaceae bacterium]
MAVALTASFDSHEAFVASFTAEIAKGGLLVRGAEASGAPAGADVTLTVSIAGGASVQVAARLAAVIPGVGVAVMFNGVPPELEGLSRGELTGEVLAEEEEEKGPPGPLSERLKKMNVTEKMQLALSGTRDERTALFRDVNKTLHIYVLKNPRIGLDEVQAAAKLPQLSPDALKMIAEHREWGSNPGVCAAVVRNPKTPVPLALRALDKVPMNELKAIAKGGARDAIVQAARRKIAG